MKDADWYVDPLGRFDGRFFDGEAWTDRVSDGGVLGRDPDFSRAESPEVAPGGSANQLVPEAPAVTPLKVEPRQKASLIEESPVRVVATLDDSVRTLPSPANDAADSEQSKSRRSPLLWWGLLALATVLLVIGIAVVGRGEPLDSAQEARVDDLEASGLDSDADTVPIEELEVDLAPGAVAPGTSFDPDETIEVGGLQVVNAQSMLADLQDWHGEFVTERGVELSSSASCWFGQLGGAAVQVAFCGPVGGSVDTEFLFDSVPIVFEDASDGQIAQPVLDAVTIDSVLPNALSLVGRDENPSPLDE